MRYSPAYLALFLSSGLASSRPRCYNQTGTEQDQNMLPCNSANYPNACCNIGGGDLCTENGLCLRQDSIANGLWYQDACISKDWTGCPTICPGTLDGDWEVAPCPGEGSPPTWCCRPAGDTTDCCTKSSAVTRANIGKVMIPTPTPSSHSGAGTITITATATAGGSTGNVSSKQPTCSNTSTVAVGAGVGASLGAVLVASLATLLWWERTRPNPQPQPTPVAGMGDVAVKQSQSDMDLRN